MEQKATLVKFTDKKLGRGLSALLGESKVKSPLFNPENQDSVEKISLKKIRAGVYQPRQHFEETELQDLADSIKEHGVIQPIILRKTDDDFYEIIAGERRFRASKIANLTEIPAIVRKFSDNDALEIAIIENVQRSDLSPTEEARGYQRLMKEFAYTQEIVAKKVGKSRAHIANLLRLLTLPEKVREYLDSKQISMGHARAIINSINPEELAKRIIAKGLNVRDAEEIVRDEKIEKAKRTPVLIRTESRIKFINSEHLVALENQISELCGMDCKISYNGFKGVGKIIMKFDEIEKIQQLITSLEK
jgi:ParB family transcriptional regulator, chromosome partitioning protein